MKILTAWASWLLWWTSWVKWSGRQVSTPFYTDLQVCQALHAVPLQLLLFCILSLIAPQFLFLLMPIFLFSYFSLMFLLIYFTFLPLIFHFCYCALCLPSLVTYYLLMLVLPICLISLEGKFDLVAAFFYANNSNRQCHPHLPFLPVKMVAVSTETVR